jgi:type IV pilus assembly protein PilQ
MLAFMREGYGVLRPLGVALVVALAACVTTPSPTGEGESVLSEVLVEQDGEATAVTLQGVQGPVYTVFEAADPSRIVVDLSDTASQAEHGSIPIFDGIVEEVRIQPFEAADAEHLRVEIVLARPVAHEVVPQEHGLELRLTDGAGEASAWSDDGGIEATLVAGAEATQPPAAQAPVDIPTGPPATTLLTVDVRESAIGTVLELNADGVIEDVDTFVLENPERLVVDLAGLSASETPAQIEVGTAHAARVRIGQHTDKVRVVVDGGELAAPFSSFRTEARSGGVTVLLGEGPGVAELASEASPAPAEPDDAWLPDALEDEPDELVVVDDEVADAELAETALEAVEETKHVETTTPEPTFEATRTDDETGFTRIYGVQLDSQTERERVAVLSDGPVSFELVDVDSETVMLRILGASIAPEAAVRMAPEKPGPLSLVSAFQQPEVETPEVRVVMKRAPGLAPELTQLETMLFLDFDRTATTAAALPVHTQGAQSSDSEAATPRSGAAGKALARAQADLAPAVPAAIDPDAGIELLQEGGLVEDKQYVGRRISLDFKDVDIDDVLRLIAEVSDLNIIAGDEVEGKVTIRLVDVPWDQALDVILLTKGLGFVRIGSVLRIAPANVLKNEEEARLQERRAMEKLEDLVVKLQPVNYADVREISKMVKRLLTPRGTVDVDRRTNTVILKDIKSVIDEATALIKAIDTQTPQVLIEAKIVEARLDFSREIGSTWAFGAQPFEDGFNPGTDRQPNLGEDVVLHNNPLLTGFTDTFNHVQVANPITSVANGLLDLGAFILDDQFNLELRLEAAESNGDGKVISSPRVVTLDNRQAEIKQGVSIPFQTFENGDAQLEFIDAVLALKVTPHITADRSIIMQVEVQRNAPDDSVQTPTGSPAIAKNEAKTETLVKDGQTLVIGGIYVIQKSERTGGVPYLNKIPIIGAAFRNREVRDARNELLIFMTPRIVVGPDAAS